jgi:hypothetical protein
MHEVTDCVTLSIGDAALTIPKESLVLAWLAQTLGGPRAKPPALAIPRIGEEWPGQGGVYAGIMRGEAGKPDYHLIVPTSPDAYAASMTWGGEGQNVLGAQSEYDGLANTMALVESGDHPAAEWCHRLDIGPHSDFYLPARREMRLASINVPELFASGWHWSSTQCASYPYYAWSQGFDVGGQSYTHKSDAGQVRAFRRLAIQ